MIMLEEYRKEINKSSKSLEMFTEFKNKLLDYRVLAVNKRARVSNEEAFIGYYRAMQLWLFENRNVEKVILRTAVELGKVRTIKIIQKIIKVKQDGVFGPITRANLIDFNLEDFNKETSRFKYQIIQFIRLWK